MQKTYTPVLIKGIIIQFRELYMNARKEKFAQELFYYVSRICQDQLSDYEAQGDRVFDVLGISKKDLWAILQKIVVALPDYIFLEQLPDLYSEVFEHLAREYILFQCQEDIDDPYFANNLANFIYEIINNINQNYNYHGR